ncbi:MAG: glycoside hydrolase family 43 protein [Clostridiales bacterium]|nr:glycoside hydrolase family 43 protein [Clostridiales bacterium]
MKLDKINIRDPFVLIENDIYYLYGSRAKNFGQNVGGFDVYTSRDLTEWSRPVECFDSKAANMNRCANWAPEVHKYNGSYYMFATFTRPNDLRGTYILKADSPTGPFHPHSDGAVTPDEWECLDGTFYIENGKPYMVFCHEHTQIINGTVCYRPLSDDLKRAAGDPVTLFHASDPFYIEKAEDDRHYVTDGPFMYKTKTGVLLMIWSTFINGKYAECVVRFKGGIDSDFEHLAPLIDDDGGHGMIFSFNGEPMLTLHSPNTSGKERPHFYPLIDDGDIIRLK